MDLSEIIEIARGYIQGYRATGVELTPEAVGSIHGALVRANERARAMEDDNRRLRREVKQLNERVSRLLEARPHGDNVTVLRPRPIPRRTPTNGGAA